MSIVLFPLVRPHLSHFPHLGGGGQWGTSSPRAERKHCNSCPQIFSLLGLGDLQLMSPPLAPPPPPPGRDAVFYLRWRRPCVPPGLTAWRTARLLGRESSGNWGVFILTGLPGERGRRQSDGAHQPTDASTACKPLLVTTFTHPYKKKTPYTQNIWKQKLHCTHAHNINQDSIFTVPAP